MIIVTDNHHHAHLNKTYFRVKMSVKSLHESHEMVKVIVAQNS